jgi:hypothetical protein
MWIFKLTSNGNVSWQKIYGGPRSVWGNSIQQTSDGQYVITGQTMSSSMMSTTDIFVIRLDQNGNIVWQKTYGGGRNDFANDIIKTSDNCYIVAADTYSFPASNTLGNILIFKISNDGTLLWQKTYGGSGIDFIRSIQETDDGGYIAGGSSSSFDQDMVFFVLKLDASGDIPDCNVAASSNVAISDAGLLMTSSNFITQSPTYSSSTFPSTKIINLDDSIVCPGSTVINLASFVTIPAAGKVVIKWSTASEIDNAGFNFYRSDSENGKYIKINTTLIAAKGFSTQGASYEFIDKNVQNRKTYYYKLKDIDLYGKSTMHGPVSATPRLIYGMKK